MAKGTGTPAGWVCGSNITPPSRSRHQHQGPPFRGWPSLDRGSSLPGISLSRRPGRRLGSSDRHRLCLPRILPRCHSSATRPSHDSQAGSACDEGTSLAEHGRRPGDYLEDRSRGGRGQGEMSHSPIRSGYRCRPCLQQPVRHSTAAMPGVRAWLTTRGCDLLGKIGIQLVKVKTSFNSSSQHGRPPAQKPPISYPFLLVEDQAWTPR